jgi:hypothetical protein
VFEESRFAGFEIEESQALESLQHPLSQYLEKIGLSVLDRVYQISISPHIDDVPPEAVPIVLPHPRSPDAQS